MGHCPVRDVAGKFHELCEAETQAFSRLLGVPVQRLATLAGGDHVCTTHVPIAMPRPAQARRAGGGTHPQGPGPANGRNPMTPSTTDAPRVSDDEIIDSISTQYDFGWHDSDEAGANAKRGLDEQVVREISAIKGEPEWMLAKRLKAYEIFMLFEIPVGPPVTSLQFSRTKRMISPKPRVTITR